MREKTQDDVTAPEYRYSNAEPGHHHHYLLPTLFDLLHGLRIPAVDRRLFELGCGNGSVANALSSKGGWDVTGVDPSESGIEQARKAYLGRIPVLAKSMIVTAVRPS